MARSSLRCFYSGLSVKLRHDSLGPGSLVISSGGSRGGAQGGRLPPPLSFLDESRGLLVEFVWGYFILELVGIDAFIAISDNCIQHLVRLKREKTQQAYGLTPFCREIFFNQ